MTGIARRDWNPQRTHLVLPDAMSAVQMPDAVPVLAGLAPLSLALAHLAEELGLL